MKSPSPFRLPLLLGISGIALAAALYFASHRPAEPSLPLVDATSEQLRQKYEAGAGLCPWRDQEKDQARFFPRADARKEGRLLLSAKQQELTRRLGRKPTGEENVQPVFYLLQGGKPLGTILTRRVRGENGAIEIVLASDARKKPIGLKIQRSREPENLHEKLETLDFVRSCGPETETRACCGSGNEAIVREGVKTLQILLAEGDAERGP